MSYNYGGSLAPGAAVTALVDEDITWETTSSLDIGSSLKRHPAEKPGKTPQRFPRLKREEASARRFISNKDN